MTALTASAAIALAIVLAVSAALKLAAPAKAAEDMRSMPLPARLVAPASVVALSVGEVVLALGLVFAFDWLLLLVSVATLLLVVGYLGLVLRAVRTTPDASCACFGAASAGRVTKWTVVRNAFLVALAVLALVGSGAALLLLAGARIPGVQSWSGWVAYTPLSGAVFPPPGSPAAPSAWQMLAQAALSFPFELGAIAALTASFVVLVLACERLGDASARIADLTTLVQAAERAAPRPSSARIATSAGSEASPDPDAPGSGHELVGTMVPAVELVSRDGRTDTLRVLLEGRPTLLFFLSATCGPCQAVAETLPEWRERIGPSVRFLTATSSDPKHVDERMPWLADLGEVRFGSASARAAFADARTPSAVLLSGDGLVATPVAMGQQEIEGLLAGVENAVRDGR